MVFLQALLGVATAVTNFLACPLPFLCARSNDVCFPPLGCFPRTGAYKHFLHDPQAPDIVGVRFRLLTRANRWGGMAGNGAGNAEPGDSLDWRDDNALRLSTFDANKPVVMVTHGFRGDVNKKWIWEICDAMLLMADYNCVVVGWGGGAKTLNYFQAMANIRVAGAEIKMMVDAMTNFGVSRDGVWLIGHSLGAHVMGEAGRRAPGVGRITGLDPASPGFEGKHVDARLDPTDALFVDVIHTDIDGFGAAEAMGSVDFYPNGGRAHPGCGYVDVNNEEGFVAETKKVVVCDHRRAYRFFIDSLLAKAESRPCAFRSRVCANYTSFLSGDCLQCRSRDCLFFMGPDAVKMRRRNFSGAVKTYLLTLDAAPYCVTHRYLLSVKLRHDFNTQKGAIDIRLTTSDGVVLDREVTHSNDAEIRPGSEIRRLTAFRRDVMPTSSSSSSWRIGSLTLQVRYRQNWASTSSATLSWHARSVVKVESASVEKMASYGVNEVGVGKITFCPISGVVDSKWQTMSECNVFAAGGVAGDGTGGAIGGAASVATDGAQPSPNYDDWIEEVEGAGWNEGGVGGENWRETLGWDEGELLSDDDYTTIAPE